MLFEVFLINKVCLESDTSNRNQCLTREQSLEINDEVNDQEFAMHYRAILKRDSVSHLKVFRCRRINITKQKDGLTSFLMLNVLEAKNF